MKAPVSMGDEPPAIQSPNNRVGLTFMRLRSARGIVHLHGDALHPNPVCIRYQRISFNLLQFHLLPFT